MTEEIFRYVITFKYNNIDSETYKNMEKFAAKHEFGRKFLLTLFDCSALSSCLGRYYIKHSIYNKKGTEKKLGMQKHFYKVSAVHDPLCELVICSYNPKNKTIYKIPTAIFRHIYKFT